MSPPAVRPAARVLVVDDEPDLRTLYELTLLRQGHEVHTVGTLAEARQALAQATYDLLITDMRLPDGTGLDLLRERPVAERQLRAIVVTAYGSAESAVQALKSGAFDYLTKPVDLRQLRTVVAAALQGPAPSSPAAPGTGAETRGRCGSCATALQRLIGSSAAMVQVKDRIARVAGSMAPVVILGESGTGKEGVARAIHACSHRASGPFIAVNCGAIPDSLLEAEFFGVRKGAYTGAQADREGFFAAARGGTLFLDEIGDLPLAMQAKLLRAIQERAVRPIGGVQEEAVDVRILCATHKDLGQAVAQGQFRQDLYYRLNVIELRLPPLRERRSDLPELVHGLMARICSETGQTPVPLSPAALQWLMAHPLPGNVRELENLLHRALALCDGQHIQPADLADLPLTAPPAPTAADSPPPCAEAPSEAAEAPLDLQRHLDAEEKRILELTLRQTRGNRTAAAARLGLNLRQIRYRIARLGITVPDPDEPHPPDA